MPLKSVAHKDSPLNGRHMEAPFDAVIADRDDMSGDLLADALRRNLGCDATAIRSSNLLQVLGERNVNLIIVSADLSAKRGVGLELASTASRSHPKIPIVILLEQPTNGAVINAFRSGARGVFNRQNSIAEFIDCIEHVRKGSIWAGEQESNVVLEALKNIPSPIADARGDFTPLSTRELQVVQCAARGITNKKIASELGLSEHTVKNYLFRAFEKLGVTSRVELLFYLTIRGHSFGPSRDASKDV
jgi:two-component system, NarL family, nitrate/nitrite response regulator NarL